MRPSRMMWDDGNCQNRPFNRQTECVLTQLPLPAHSTCMPKFQPPRTKTVAVRVWLKVLWSDRATYRAAARSKKDAHSAVNSATFGVFPTVCLMFSCSVFFQGNMGPTSVLCSSSTCCTSYCLCGPVSVSSASRRQGTFS